MTDNNPGTKRYVDLDVIVKLLPLLAFAAPLALLFILNPADPYLKVSAQGSFSLMWKGRTFQLFFVWLILLEFILSWDAFKPKINKQNPLNLAAFAVALLLPTIYVVSEYYLGLNGAIANWSMSAGVAFFDSMPLSVEYLVFSVLFCLVAFFCFGKSGIKRLALPGLFAALVGDPVHDRQRVSKRGVHAVSDVGSDNRLACLENLELDGMRHHAND